MATREEEEEEEEEKRLVGLLSRSSLI